MTLALCISYFYSLFMTFFYLSTNELENKPIWQSWMAAIFWPLCLVGGVVYIGYLLCYGLVFKAIPRWHRHYKWVRSDDYKQKRAKIDALFQKSEHQ